MILRRAATVAGLVAALLSFSSGVAAAHGGGIGPEAHIPRILAVDPPVPGLDVAVIEAGERLRLDNRTGAAVEIVPPDGATRMAPVGPGETARWTDPRVMAAAADPAPPDGRRGWAVVLRAGEQTVTVRGEQVWPDPPSAGPWWWVTLITAVAVAVTGTVAVTRRRWAPALASITLLVAAAHVVHVLGSALVIEDRSLVGVALGAAGPAVLAWVLAVVGAALTLARHGYGPLLCALSGAVLALVTAFAAGTFSSAVLPFAWAADLDRATVVLTLGGGVGLFVTGFAALRVLTPESPVQAQQSPS